MLHGNYRSFLLKKNTCIEQLLVDLVIYRQVDVVVLLATVGQVAVDGVVSGLEDPVLVVFQWLQ